MDDPAKTLLNAAKRAKRPFPVYRYVGGLLYVAAAFMLGLYNLKSKEPYGTLLVLAVLMVGLSTLFRVVDLEKRFATLCENDGEAERSEG